MKNKDLWIISWRDRKISTGLSLFFGLLNIAYLDSTYNDKTGVYFHAGQNLAVIYRIGSGSLNIWVDSKMLLAIISTVIIIFIISK